MTSQKQYIKDGVSRFIVKSDFDRLKGKSMQASVLAAEAILKEGWTLCQGHSLPLDKVSVPYGRFMTRVPSFLVKKQSKAPDGIEFDSLEDISAAFGDELRHLKDKGVLASAAPQGQGSAASQEKPQRPVSLDDSSDPVQIALATYNVSLGSLYVFTKQPGKVFELTEMKASTAVFQHKPFFGNLEVSEVKHEELKKVRIWSKDLPVLQPATILAALQPCNSMVAEFGRAKAQHLLFQKYQELLGI